MVRDYMAEEALDESRRRKARARLVAAGVEADPRIDRASSDYLGTNSSSSVRSVTGHLVYWFDYCLRNNLVITDVTRVEAKGFARHLETRYAPATIHARCAVIRQFYRILFARVQGATNPFDGVGTESPDPLTPTPALTQEEYGLVGTMVFNEASKSPGSAAARDAAMVHLVFRIGLRGIETRRLTWGDITTDRGVSVVRLFGKGRKAATLTLPDDVVAVLASWRSQLEAAAGRTVRHDDAMFPSIGRGSSIIKSAVAKDSALKPISPGRLIQIFKTTLERAGVGGYRRATHTGRATAASIAYEQTGDILGVQKMLRHANLEQSAKYIRRENDCRAMTSSWTPAISSPGFPHGRS